MSKKSTSWIQSVIRRPNGLFIVSIFLFSIFYSASAIQTVLISRRGHSNQNSSGAVSMESFRKLKISKLSQTHFSWMKQFDEIVSEKSKIAKPVIVLVTDTLAKGFLLLPGRCSKPLTKNSGTERTMFSLLNGRCLFRLNNKVILLEKKSVVAVGPGDFYKITNVSAQQVTLDFTVISYKAL